MSDTGPADDPGIPGLSADQLESIFRLHVVPSLTREGPDLPVPQEQPEVVFLLAQPAAGTSMVVDRIQRELDDRGGIVAVFPPGFRIYHPDYLQLRQSDPVHVHDATGPAARWFADRSIEWLRDARYNVLVEDTSGDPVGVLAAAGRFADVGYDVRIAALAVPPALSRITIIERFARVAEITGTGPWTSAEEHDTRYAATAELIRRAETSAVVSRITVDTRDGPVHDVERALDGTWRNRNAGRESLTESRRSALDVLDEARGERLTSLQRRALANRLATTLVRLQGVDVNYAKVHEMAASVHRDLRSTGFEQPVTHALTEALEDLRAVHRALDAGVDTAAGTNSPELPAPTPGRDAGPEIGPVM